MMVLLGILMRSVARSCGLCGLPRVLRLPLLLAWCALFPLLIAGVCLSVMLLLCWCGNGFPLHCQQEITGLEVGEQRMRESAMSACHTMDFDR